MDLSIDPSGDAGFAAVEQLAQVMLADPGGLPPLLVRVIRALYRNAARQADRLNEPAEVIFFSFVVNGLVHLMGGDYYNGPAIEAVLGFERGSVSDEVLEVLNSKLRMSIADLDQAYRSVPVEEISVMAERLAAWAPHLLRHLGVTGADQAEIDDLAVLVAPGAVHYVTLLRAAFDDFPDEPLPYPSAIPALPAASSRTRHPRGAGRPIRAPRRAGVAGTVSSQHEPGYVGPARRRRQS